MKKDNESENNSTSDESTEYNQEDNKSLDRRSQKVMIPFFGDQSPKFNTGLKSGNGYPPRRPKFNQSDSYLPRNRSFNAPRLSPRALRTKEVGMNAEPLKPKQPPLQSKNFRNSYPTFKVKGKKNFNEPNGDYTPGRKIVYIDKSNVGNIRPLSSLYDKPSPKAKPLEQVNINNRDPRVDHVGAYRQDFRHEYQYRHELNCPLNNEPCGPQINFVDALIRNSNTFEDVLVDDSRSTLMTTKDNKTNNNTNSKDNKHKSNKSQELKTVLTKMGILDKSQGPKDLSFKELDNDLEKHYVFPKYMTSPDPSSIPIPGSL